MQHSQAQSDFMNELSAPLCPALAAKVQSSDLWRVCGGSWKKGFDPLTSSFSGEVLIKTGVRSGSTCGTLSPSERGNKEQMLMFETCQHKVTVTEKHTHSHWREKKKKHVEFIYCSVPLSWIQLISWCCTGSFNCFNYGNHLSAVFPPFTVQMKNENVLPSGAT